MLSRTWGIKTEKIIRAEKMKSSPRFVASLMAGCVTAIVIAYAGFTLLRALWPEYAGAEPHKDYTLAMLFSRLALGALCTSGAACVATIAAGDNGRAALWLGTLFAVVSLPSHLYYSWNDYPVWYHLLYLSYLIPIAGLTGRVLRVERRGLPAI